MLSLGIIWNPAVQFEQEIIFDMKNKVNIIGYFDIDFQEYFKDFFYELYDDEEKWKRDKKYINVSLNNCVNNKIIVIIYEFNPEKIEYHPQKKKDVYSDLNNLKIYIRRKYSEKISNYVFDNIFHSSDDLEEFKKSYQILRKYLMIVLKDKLEISFEKEMKKRLC